MPINWNLNWNIGHDKIDEQHQKWVNIFNQLETTFINSELGYPVDSQLSLLKQLADYTHYHFADEEELMVRVDYPDTQSHWRIHKNFDVLIYEKYRLIEGGQMVLTSEILQLMRNWLVNHILTEDIKIAEFINSSQRHL